MIRRRARLWLAAALLLGAPTLALAQSAESVRDPEQPSPRHEKTEVVRYHHMVVAANPLAADAGVAMLRAGGSAVDAAIAAELVLNLVEPQSSGIGGGAFMLHWDNAAKKLTSYDGRETAPAGATSALFLDADGKPLPFREAVPSGRAVGVPGLLQHVRAGAQGPWQAALGAPLPARHRPRRERLPHVAAPAPAGRVRAGAGRAFRRRGRSISMRDGEAKLVGARIVNRPLAATLRRIAEERRRRVLHRRDRRRHRAHRRGRAASARDHDRGRPRRLSGQGAPAGLRALSPLARLRHGPAELGRRRACCRSWRCSSASTSRRSRSIRSRRCISWPRPASSPSPTATAIWPIPISSTCRSRACSTGAYLATRSR